MAMCAFDSNASLVIVPDLGRPVYGETSEEGTGFLRAGAVLGRGVVVLPLTGAVVMVGRTAGFVVGRERDVARLG